jgi:hypothetical protein
VFGYSRAQEKTNTKFDTLELAKIAVFHGIEYFKETNEW